MEFGLAVLIIQKILKAFFTAIPFGPSPGELLGWYHYGGGKELWEEIYHRHNVHPVQCLMISPEASGWFKKEIPNKS